MIDGIKIYDLKSDPQKLIENSYLDGHWKTTINSDAEPLFDFAEYFGLKFQLKHGKVRLQGSIHKYRNEGRHNYDDFKVVDVEKVVKELTERFEIDTAETLLNNVEFGVNVVLPFKVNVVLNNLIAYKGKEFIRVSNDGMNYYQCAKTHFIIKIYDKGKQYNLPNNVLRFEIKVMRMQYLETKGIKLRYLSDLLNRKIYEPLGNILTEVFEGILFGDNTINEKLLNVRELEILLRGSNPKTWIPQTGEKERKRLQRLENDFTGLLERHRTGVNFRSEVSNLIRAKSLELSRFYQPQKDVEQNIEIVPFLHFSYSVNSRQSLDNDKVKKCANCKKVLNDNQLKYQLNYCSGKCKIKKDERNQRSNPRNDFKKQFKRVIETPSLFDVFAIMKLSEQQKKWIRKT